MGVRPTGTAGRPLPRAAAVLAAVGVAAAVGACPAHAAGPSVAGAAPAPLGAQPTAVHVRAAAASPLDAPTATLRRDTAVRAAPRISARTVTRVSARRPITEARTVLPVLERRTAAEGATWLRVLLPGRPNGRTAWLPGSAAATGTTPWAIEVDRSTRRVTVREHGRVVRRFRTVVGTRATPTPTGRFFVEETIRLPAGRAAGPFALALSARSSVLQEFDGGPGQIAMHGRDGLGGVLGTGVSHGCMRLGTDAIRWTAARIGPGVRVTVRA